MIRVLAVRARAAAASLSAQCVAAAAAMTRVMTTSSVLSPMNALFVPSACSS